MLDQLKKVAQRPEEVIMAKTELLKTKFKLIAVDMDGTLLNSDGKISWQTKEVIEQAVQKGILFTLSTGRPMQGITPFMEELNLIERNMPVIAYNGAMVILGKSGAILYEKNLSHEDAIRFYRLGEEKDVTVIAWVHNRLYVNQMDGRAQRYTEISKIKPTVMVNPEETLKQGATKILWYDDIKTIEKLEKDIQSMISENVTCHTSRPMFLEFVDKNASKGIAMEKLGAYYGISRDEMMSVGDGSNDLSMIEYAGLGVAMENANDAVKAIANYQTLSNDQHGVAHVIRKFILGTES